MKVIYPLGILLPKHTHFFSKKTFLRAWYFTGTLLYFTAWPCCHASAQDLSPAKLPNIAASLGIPEGGLKIGDTIPEALWHLPLQVVNHPEGKDTITLNDYRGKLIILDFWGIWCASCVQALPKLDQLQQQFPEDLRVLLVVGQPRQNVVNFYSRNAITKNLRLPSVVDDRYLSQYFVHKAISHLVWINPAGILKTSTGTGYADTRFIKHILSGKEPTWKPKIDALDYDYSQPLFGLLAPPENIEHPRNRNPFYSALGGYLEGVLPKERRQTDSINQTTRWYTINVSLYHLILSAHKLNQMMFQPSHVIWQVSDKGRYDSRYSTDPGEKWERNNYYCHEAQLPVQSGIDEWRHLLAMDLQRYFPGLKTSLQRRNIACLKLVRTSKRDKIKAKSHAQVVQVKDSDPVKIWESYPIETVVYDLNKYFEETPVFDETNYREIVDIALPVISLRNIEAVRKALHAYDLDLVVDQRLIDVLVISDHPTTFSAY